MKKIGYLIGGLLLFGAPGLFSLEVYLNGELWQHYTEEDVEALSLRLSPLGEPLIEGIPLLHLLPFLRSWEGVVLDFGDAEEGREFDLPALRESYLKVSPQGNINLYGPTSSYQDFYRIRIEGQPWKKTITVWGDVHTSSVRKELEIWATLQQVPLQYREFKDIRGALLFTEMTGGELPDFIVYFHQPDEEYEPDKTIAYALQSTLIPSTQGKGEAVLVLPSGRKYHPDLFLSLAASFLEEGDSLLPLKEELVQETITAYTQRILDYTIQESREDFSFTRNYQGREFYYFPAREFPEYQGEKNKLPGLEGNESSLPSRLLPLQVKQFNQELPQEFLLNYLRLPGIQSRFLSLRERMVPANPELYRREDTDPQEWALIEEWRQGFLLLEQDRLLELILQSNTPDFLALKEQLTRY